MRSEERNVKSVGNTTNPTLQDVLDRLAADPDLTPVRRRDLRAAIAGFARLRGVPTGAIPLDLAAIRATLDAANPAQMQVSAKRFSNLRSDLAAAIETSGLITMFKSSDVQPSAAWVRLLGPDTERRVRFGISRFVRWATHQGVAPHDVTDDVIARYIAELESATLVRNLCDQHKLVASTWNRLVAFNPGAGLAAVRVPTSNTAKVRVPWETVPVSFREEVERYLAWAAMPDPLDEGARTRALAPKTLHLRREQIHSGLDAAVAAGIPVAKLTALAALLEPGTFKALLRQRWQQDGRKLTAYTHGVAGTLIAVAHEWLKLPPEQLALLKSLRGKLGSLPTGLTDKNRTMLRRFDDPHLLEQMVGLPDRLWHAARREPAASRRPFITLQTALAIDILLHAPIRMENLSVLEFDRHIQWPQGRGKPALIILPEHEVKNDNEHQVELPTVLSDRLHLYREQIVPRITGTRPLAVFVTWSGTPRCQGAITVAIEKMVFRHLGVKITPHQFRHLAAKIILDANPGAYELARQVLGHKNLKTTANFYAGIDTRRAGRAHAALLDRLRDNKLPRTARTPPPGWRQQRKKT
jgi:integrase